MAAISGIFSFQQPFLHSFPYGLGQASTWKGHWRKWQTCSGGKNRHFGFRSLSRTAYLKMFFNSNKGSSLNPQSEIYCIRIFEPYNNEQIQKKHLADSFPPVSHVQEKWEWFQTVITRSGRLQFHKTMWQQKKRVRKKNTCKLSAKKGELDNRFFAAEAIRSLLRNCHPRTERSN